MALSGLLPILVPFILLEGIQGPGLVEGLFIKNCPKVRIKCEIEERSQCIKHRHCPEQMKCCLFSCGKKCLDLRKDICGLPQKVGPCLAYIPRWWYNKETERCSEFIYGGCQGNNNNFQSEAICMVTCQEKCKSQGPKSPVLTTATWRGLGVGRSVPRP
ncbi:PREDICTED: WAP four-disulfide core domain protein 6A-like [Propithecus coquereli]|uniref:WAP four-disulfide core domain protein 6A-like n=1 Tax=Propithecus coquereli TaxID=379532 RepID=UPI00063F35B3|nr:PREDICTED: WAP four-disulfide core domain protein 6A-like [Propithecus coquereli]